MVRRRRFQDGKRVRVFPRTGPLARRPSCGEIHVESWFHLDRAHVAAYDEDRQLIAEWWDEEVDAMFDKGVFSEGEDFEESVIAYLTKVGTCRRPESLGRRR